MASSQQHDQKHQPTQQHADSVLDYGEKPARIKGRNRNKKKKKKKRQIETSELEN